MVERRHTETSSYDSAGIFLFHFLFFYSFKLCQKTFKKALKKLDSYQKSDMFAEKSKAWAKLKIA